MKRQRRGYDRRTGWALLALGVSSNFLPWMELVTGLTTTQEPVGPREWGMELGMCLLAAVLACAAWLAGRRRQVPSSTRLKDPRRTGLQATLALVVANGLLTAVIVFLGTREVGGPLAEFGTFAFLWCLVCLPLQVLAAFALGTASTHSVGRRRTEGPPAEGAAPPAGA